MDANALSIDPPNMQEFLPYTKNYERKLKFFVKKFRGVRVKLKKKEKWRKDISLVQGGYIVAILNKTK